MSVTQFKLIFVRGERSVSRFTSLHVDVQSSQHHFGRFFALFFFFFFSPLLPCHRAADCFCGVCFWDLHSVPLLCWPALLPVVSLFYFIKNTFWLHIHLPTKGKKLVCDKILRAVKNYNFIKKPTGEDKNVFWETAFHFWKKYDFIKVSTIDLIKMKPEVNLPDNTIWKLYKSFFFVRKLHNSTHLGIPKTTKHPENEKASHAKDISCYKTVIQNIQRAPKTWW